MDPIAPHRARIAHAGALVNLAVHSTDGWAFRRDHLMEALAIMAEVVDAIDHEQTGISPMGPKLAAAPSDTVDSALHAIDTEARDAIGPVARFAHDYCSFGPTYSYSSEMLYSLWRSTGDRPELSHRKFLEALFTEFPRLSITPMSDSDDSRFLITGIQPTESESINMDDDNAISSVSIG